MLLPRLSALSEVLWSSKANRDFGNFMARMPAQEARLQAMDVNYRKSGAKTLK